MNGRPTVFSVGELLVYLQFGFVISPTENGQWVRCI